MRRVVVTGSECTGKTTLALALATHYRTVCVPEYARAFVDEQGRAPEYRDVEAIARGQMAGEDALATPATRLVVQDTDLLSTIVYSKHYYGACPDWIEVALENRSADLYLLADIDVPWEADGLLRDRGERRTEMHELFRQALVERGLRHTEVRGSRRQRLERAVAAVDLLLSEAAGA